MNYHPLFGMNILVSNEFMAILQYSLFNIFVFFLLMLLTAYQVRRSVNRRKGQC